MSSRFPPVGLFDRVSEPEDLEAVFYIESLTNDRLREEAGELSLVVPEGRIAGPGTGPSWPLSPISIRIEVYEKNSYTPGTH